MEFEQVRDIIVETLGVDADQVTPEATLTDDLGADSLALAELMMAVEEASDITIADEALEDLKTVADVVAYLNANQA